MALNYVRPPIDYYPDFNTGRPIFNGDIYVGEPDTDPEIGANQKQITIRQEDGTEIPVSQPMKTSSGGVPIYNGSPVQILVDGNYSIKVLNKQLSQVYYQENAFDGEPVTTTTGDTRYAAIFGSVADMLALTPLGGVDYVPVSGDLVRTTSYYTSIPYTEPQGGGGEYRVMSLAEYGLTPDEFGAAFTVGGFAFVLQVEGSAVTPQHFGIRGNDAVESHARILALRDSGLVVDWGSNTYRIPDRIPLLLSNSNLTWRASKATLKLDSGTAEYAIYIPTVGDGDLEVLGAENVTVDGFIFDGSLATAGIAGFETWNAAKATFSNCESNNWGLSGGIIKTTASGDTDIGVYNYRATGNTNHGIAVATLNADPSRVLMDGVWSHGNGLGIDISTGSATVSNVRCWNNTNGGMKTAGNDSQHLILSNADLSDNAAPTAQGFYTNGTFGLLEMSNVRAVNNGAQGIQIAHAGTVLASNIYCLNNGGIGLHQSGAATAIYNGIHSEGNGDRGVLIGAGVATVTSLQTKLNSRTGLLISTLDACSVASHISIDDCTSSDNFGLICQPAATGGLYNLGHIIAIDTGGAGGVTAAISLNSNTEGCSIDSIQTSGAAIVSTISDSGVNTSYGNANGQAKMPHDRIGFYSTIPKAKQSITGSRGGNAALTDLLTKLDSLGLITDATT